MTREVHRLGEQMLVVEIKAVYSYSQDWACRWTVSSARALGLKMYQGLWVEYPGLWQKRRVFAPWLPVCFAKTQLNDRVLWQFPLETGCSASLRVIRLDYKCNDKEAEIAATAGVLFHVIELSMTYQDYFRQLPKRLQQKCKQADRELTFTEHSAMPAAESGKIKALFVQEHIRLKSPCPPHRYIETLLEDGAATICIGRKQGQIVGFFLSTCNSGIYHVPWMVLDSRHRTNYHSIGMWHEALRRAFSTQQKIFSMGTTSSRLLADFKERLGGQRSLIEFGSVGIDGSFQTKQLSGDEMRLRCISRKALRHVTKVVIATKSQCLYNRFSEICWRISNG